MRAFVIVLVCLVFAAGAEAGDNPDVNIFLEFENGQNYIDPPTAVLFTVTVYLENFGSGGGTTGLEFMLVRSFSGSTISATSLLDGAEIGDPDSGWSITGSCELPDGTGRVAVAEVRYYYDGYNPGSLEVADHPWAARDVLDCSSGIDSWCVRLSPSGHAGVGVAAPPGDCLAANPCIEVTKDVDCDISKVGDEVEYTICVTNCSVDTDLFNITVVDDVMGDLSAYFPSSFSAGQTECAVFPYTIQPGDPDPLVNIVTATGEDAYGTPVNDSNMAQVDLIHPSFTVTKTCLTPLVPPGGDAEFEITITNTGDCDLYITTSAPGIGPFRLLWGDTFVTVVTVPNPGGVTEICNDIDVVATIPPEYCNLPNVLFASAEDCCPCAPDAEIIVTKDVNCDISKVGDEVEYTICVTNASSFTDLLNVTVVDDVLGDLSSLFSSTLLVGETECHDLPYTIQPGDDSGYDYPGAVHENTVTATAETGAGLAVDDSATETVYLIHPGLTVTKTCLTPLVPPGGDAEFEITITNTGDCDLDITTSAPGIGPFRLPPYDTFVTVETVPNPGGVTEICNDIDVLATIPPEYCNLPNVLVASARDCCPCAPATDDRDYGDAPYPYRTLQANDGASHVVDSTVFISIEADTEPDGQPDPDALGDDNDGSDDEECDLIMGNLAQGEPTYIMLEASVDGFLDGWVDFFQDGSWIQPVDQVFISEPLTAGWNLVSFITPMPAHPGDTFMRLRFSLIGGLDPFGAAPEGEVEDFAVEILASEKFKWVQLPDPDVTGMDVNCSEDYLAADDFRCKNPGRLTEFDIWGSWFQDILPDGDPENVAFKLAIHEDIPARLSSTGYSMPGNVLWARVFSPGTFAAREFMPYIEEGWLEPPENYIFPGDWTMWLYTFSVPPPQAYHQTGTPTHPDTLWLSVQAIPQAEASFGWKTSRRHWNDDAVWELGTVPHPGPWEELIYPPGHVWEGDSIDLAFGIRMTFGVGVPDEEVGDSSLLRQNVPNPFNPKTVIEYVLPSSGRVTLEIYDATGHLVRHLVDGTQEAGEQTAAWDGRDDEGRQQASGVYFYRLKTDATEVTRKMVILK